MQRVITTRNSFNMSGEQQAAGVGLLSSFIYILIRYIFNWMIEVLSARWNWEACSKATAIPRKKPGLSRVVVGWGGIIIIIARRVKPPTDIIHTYILAAISQ